MARKRIMPANLLSGILLALCPHALALDPSLDVSQYAHFSWKYRDGFAKSAIRDIAQTSDGYLWFSTGSGLLRFDGVSPVPWRPPIDQPLPSSDLTRLLAARDGTLWIGARNGLASWKDGKLTQYAEFVGLRITRLIEDHEGSIWVAAYDLPNGKLCEIEKGRVRCAPEFHDTVFGLYEDRKGRLWAGSPRGLWRWKPGQPQLYDLPEPRGIQGIVDAEDGGILICDPAGIRRLLDGKWKVAIPLPASVRNLARNMLRDRDGALWVTTSGGGLVHIHQGRTDVFSHSDGLTGATVSSLLEDREGNIWAATPNGLDRFGELPVVTYSVDQGVPAASAAVVADRDGSIWFTSNGLNRLDHGQLTVYRQRASSTAAEVHEIRGSGVPSSGLWSLLRDPRGRIWVSSPQGIGYLENDRFVRAAAPGGSVITLTQDSAGNLWIAYQDRGLLRLSPDNEIQQTPWNAFGDRGPGQVLPDPVRGGLWLGFRKGGVLRYRDGQVRASYSAADGLAAGAVNQLRLDGQGALWIATNDGLSRLAGGRVRTLTSQSGLPCEAVLWSLEADDRSVWLGMSCGLVRVARAELDKWASDARGKAAPAVKTTVFDSTDGARMPGGIGGIGPHADKSPDGKLWFVTPEGLSVVDPRHLPFNRLAPPVYIQAVKIDGKQRGPDQALKLPHTSNDLEIDYTALSFTDPGRVFFRYKLEGHDRDWQEVGTRRQAFYGGLAPKNYRFRVIACNNNGVWNEVGATWAFSITPAYYQTIWFQTLCGLAFLAALWGLYRLRLYQIAREFNVRLEERVGERTRLARDLHDTLLQSFHGLMLHFQVVNKLLPEGKAKEQMEKALDRADQAIAEGRSAVYDLRSSATTTNDLAEAVTAVGDQLSADHEASFDVLVEGDPRDLHPIIRDEIYRISVEALRNAFRHARARHVEAEIGYGERIFRLRIRDDGQGIMDEMLDQGRPGHYGLAGMRERAKQIGAELNIWSRAGSGTEIELRLAGSIAYPAAPRRFQFRLFQKKVG